MIWVLVVIGWLGGYASGPITTFQTFHSQAVCQAVAHKITNYVESDKRVMAFCQEDTAQ